jgi:hypothetical protein
MSPLKPLCLLLLAGCGVSKFREDSPLLQRVPRFGSVEVRVAPVEFEVSADVRPELDAFAAALPHRISEALRRRNLLEAEGRPLLIDLKILAYDPGSRAARWIVGFGLGTGAVEVGTLLQDCDAALGSGTARGTVWGGMFGGTMSTAHGNLVRAVVDYVARCCEER